MKSLAKALVEAVAFLELSGDEVVDPDSAVRALEWIAECLKSASESEKQALLDYCQEKAASGTEKQQEFYKTFSVAMGLVDT